MNGIINNLITALNNTGRAFCDFSIAMFIQASVLIVLLFVIDILIRKRVRATFRYCIWMLVFIKLILPPALSLPTGIGNWFGEYFVVSSENIDRREENINQESSISAESFRTEFSPRQVLDLQNFSRNDTPWVTETQEVSTVPQAIEPDITNANSITWQGGIFLVWLVGVLVLSVLLIQRIFFVKGLIAQSEPAKNRLLDTLQECFAQLGIKRNIQMKLSHNASSPAVCGLFKPVILIPANLLIKISHDKFKAILIHELSHIKRNDLLVNCTQTILQILYFYNPLVWLANSIVRKIREQAVDEMVLVALGAEAKSYTSTLIDVAEMAFSRPALSLRLVGVVESKKALSERIKHILSRPIPKSAKLGFMGMLVILTAGFVLLPMGRAQYSKQDIPYEDCQAVYDFDGTNDYLEIPDNNALDIGQTFTAECWMKAEHASGEDSIFSKEIPWQSGWTLILDSGGIVETRYDENKSEQQDYYALTFAIGNGDHFTNLNSIPVIKKNNWHHVAATFDNGKGTIFVDGRIVCTQELPFGANASVPLRIGKGSKELGRHFKGKLADLRIWNNARSLKEIQQNMFRKLSGNEQGLVANWTLKPDSYGRIEDISVNKLNTKFYNSDKAQETSEQDNFIAKLPMAGQEVTNKQRLQNLVENWFKNNYLDIRQRKTIEWGEPQKNKDGSYSISYKYEAKILNKDKIIDNEIFSFTENGKFVSVKKVEGFPINAEASGQFTDTLPNGVMVELLGICEHPSEGKQWWKPDGSTLQEAPYDDSWGRAFPKDGEKGYKFAVKFSGLAGKDVDGCVTTANFKSTNGGSLRLTATKNNKELVKYKDGKVDERIVWLGAAYDEALEKCNIIAGVSFGQWKSEYNVKDDKPNDAVEWVVFQNVPLKPNFNNDVQIETETIANQNEIGSVERSKFITKNKAGEIISELGFEKLVNNENGVWELDKAYMNILMPDFSCHITADKAITNKISDELDINFNANVVVHIEPNENGDFNDLDIYLDNLSYKRDKSLFSSEGPAKIISRDSQYLCSNIELKYNVDSDGNYNDIRLRMFLIKGNRNIDNAILRNEKGEEIDIATGQNNQEITFNIPVEMVFNISNKKNNEAITKENTVENLNTNVEQPKLFTLSDNALMSLDDHSGSTARIIDKRDTAGPGVEFDIYFPHGGDSLSYNSSRTRGKAALTYIDLDKYIGYSLKFTLLNVKSDTPNIDKARLGVGANIGSPGRYRPAFFNLTEKNKTVISSTGFDSVEIKSFDYLGFTAYLLSKDFINTNGVTLTLKIEAVSGADIVEPIQKTDKVLSEADKANLLSMFITIGTTCESVESAINKGDIETAKKLCESIEEVTQKMKALAKSTEFEAVVTAGAMQYDLMHQVLKEGNIENAKTYINVIMQLGNNSSQIFKQLISTSDNINTSVNKQGGTAAEGIKENSSEVGITSEQERSSLQQMIDSAEPESTIIIPNGKYTQPVEIAKPLILKGQSRKDCILEITADNPAIFINTKSKGKVTLENMTIKWQLATSDQSKNPYAIAAKDSVVFIKNCSFEPLGNSKRSPEAVRSIGFSDMTIDTCRLEGFEYTVCFGEGSKGTIQNSLIMNSGHQGISLYEGAVVKIIGNVITGSKYHGVRSTGGTLDMKDNLIIKNDNRGVYLGNKSANGTIENNVIIGNGSGISGFSQSKVTIENNVLVDNGYSGIDMRDSCKLSIRDNIIKGNERGLALFKEGSKNNNEIYRNTFWQNQTETQDIEKSKDSILADPLFKNAENGDFSLNSGPAKEAKQGLKDTQKFIRLWKIWKNRADKNSPFSITNEKIFQTQDNNIDPNDLNTTQIILNADVVTLKQPYGKIKEYLDKETEIIETSLYELTEAQIQIFKEWAVSFPGTSIVSNQKIYTNDGQSSRFNITSQGGIFPKRPDPNAPSDRGQVFERITSGIYVELTPHLNKKEKTILMEMAAEISNIFLPEDKQALPSVSRRSTRTMIRIPTEKYVLIAVLAAISNDNSFKPPQGAKSTNPEFDDERVFLILKVNAQY